MIISRSLLIKLVSFLVLLFFLLFPKGGFKLAGVPITWGYIVIGLIALILVFRKIYYLPKNNLAVFLAISSFQISCFISFFLNGISSMGYAISLVVNFCLLPIFFFLIVGENINLLSSFFWRFFRGGVLFIACYGIFLFIYSAYFRKFLEIPFLTVNFDDVGQLMNKCNARGFFFKLTSTYNNGNIYGVCVLMLLPLYAILETSRWKKWIVKLSLILSLSRTVWIGFVLYEIFSGLFLFKDIKKRLLVVLGCIVFFVVLSAIISSSPLKFLLNTNLGGRSDCFERVLDPTFFGKAPFIVISEVVYVGILSSFGLFGLITFLFAMIAPIVVYFSDVRREGSIQERSILMGLIIYLIISWSDGAILLIPVMVFYWFLCSLLLHREASKKIPLPAPPK